MVQSVARKSELRRSRLWCVILLTLNSTIRGTVLCAFQLIAGLNLCVDGGDCLMGVDDLCPDDGEVPICPGTTCTDGHANCQGNCYKVPDSIQFVPSRIGDGKHRQRSYRRSVSSKIVPIVGPTYYIAMRDAIYCGIRCMRSVPKLRGAPMGSWRLHRSRRRRLMQSAQRHVW